MPNLLAIPFKKTYPIDIKEAARQYIFDHGGAHPDEFKGDIKAWQDLRKDGVGGVVHQNRVDAALLYHAQLVSILTKLPADIQLSIAYAPVFNPSAVPITLRNLIFERASVLFNLASLYSRIAAAEDRSTSDGIKRAASNYQQAAGTLSFMHSSVLPKLIYSPDDEEKPLDLSNDFVKALEWLMLAQAQECTWQLAKLSQYKNSLIAKIAAGASSLYRSAAATIREALPPIKQILPTDWLPHIEAKEHHFSAVAEYRESMVEYEASRYGFELGRLGKAQMDAQKAYDIARRGKIATPVLQDVQSLLETVRNSEVRAQRDNDLIYHHDVPSPSALPAIQATRLVSPTVPKALINPASVLGNRHPLFGELVGWGAREAINIYNDRKQNLIKEKIVDFAQELQDQADEELRKLNLPSALEALERPVGLPPSLLRKAEEVRLEDGPAKIVASIEDVQRLAHQDLAILEEALDILDSEASEDEAARKDVPLNRLKSHEANVELIEKSARYRSILNQAAASDESVRQKWDEWEESITELTLDEATLEASIPSSTVSSAARATPQGKQTRQHARALRVKLEDLDTLSRDRDQIVHRARSLAAADDIQPRILKASSGFERLAEVQAEMFEDVSDEQLAKFDKFLVEMAEIERKQKEILEEIQNKNKEFLDSRREDPVVKEREHALQSLDLAYFKYREITRNLDEGFKFYNDLAGILMQYKEVCKNWSLQRNQEIHALTRSFQSMDVRDGDSVAGTPKKTHPSTSPTPTSGPARKQPLGKSSLGLPAINSSEWDFEEISLPPGPKDRGK
ncbi:BRO1-like domain-containing protein [Crassisporium funariophilum]|nr:BRO1-like domain-containing protein [Crassisporium funariophilum]